MIKEVVYGGYLSLTKLKQNNSYTQSQNINHKQQMFSAVLILED